MWPMGKSDECVCVSVWVEESWGGGFYAALDLHPGCTNRRQMQPFHIPDVAAFIGGGVQLCPADSQVL